MIKKFFSKKEKITANEYSPQDIEKIKERAYFIWLNKGKSAGSAVCDWLLAEKELKNEGKI
ncbi:MAG: DUF2934 domain-containing protein [Candidatus Omnitrophica bacterium]|nr:DUF2934 domain-containing protein [Candidatus Omnitrophota bacterium]